MRKLINVKEEETEIQWRINNNACHQKEGLAEKGGVDFEKNDGDTCALGLKKNSCRACLFLVTKKYSFY